MYRSKCDDVGPFRALKRLIVTAITVGAIAYFGDRYDMAPKIEHFLQNRSEYLKEIGLDGPYSRAISATKEAIKGELERILG